MATGDEHYINSFSVQDFPIAPNRQTDKSRCQNIYEGDDEYRGAA
jgi:hypothetical protein